jgi:predicted extracellular nuclease
VQLRSEAKRLQLAQIIRHFVDDGLAQDPAKNIMLMGDFNDFEFSPVIKTLEGTTLTNLVGQHEAADRYSYFYGGNNQILDNIIVSKNLVPRCTFDIVHVNSPFMPDDRVSDHDPLLVQVDLP